METKPLTIKEKIDLQTNLLAILQQTKKDYSNSVETQAHIEVQIRQCLNKIQSLTNLETTGREF